MDNYQVNRHAPKNKKKRKKHVPARAGVGGRSMPNGVPTMMGGGGGGGGGGGSGGLPASINYNQGPIIPTSSNRPYAGKPNVAPNPVEFPQQPTARPVETHPADTTGAGGVMRKNYWFPHWSGDYDEKTVNKIDPKDQAAYNEQVKQYDQYPDKMEEWNKQELQNQQQMQQQARPGAAAAVSTPEGQPQTGEINATERPDTLRLRAFEANQDLLADTELENVLQETLFNAFTYVPPNGCLGENALYRDWLRNQRLLNAAPQQVPRAWEPVHGLTAIWPKLANTQPHRVWCYPKGSEYSKPAKPIDGLEQPHTVLDDDFSTLANSRCSNSGVRRGIMRPVIQTQNYMMPAWEQPEALNGKFEGKNQYSCQWHPFTPSPFTKHPTTSPAEQVIYKKHFVLPGR